jgi:secreted PhoX family phosphatase
LFVAVQHPPHPAELGRMPRGGEMMGAWPDFRAGVPARPAVVGITRRGGGKI